MVSDGKPEKTYPFDPDWCMRPGVMLEELMSDMGLSKRMLAKVCLTDVATIDGILDGTVQIDAQVSAQLSLLGISRTFWLNWERTYRAGLAAGKIDVSDD